MSFFEIIRKKGLVAAERWDFYADFPAHELFEILKNTFHLPESLLHQICAEAFGFSVQHLADLVVDATCQTQPVSFYRTQRIIPIFQDDKGGLVATDNPFQPYLTQLGQQQAWQIVLIPASEVDQYWQIERAVGCEPTLLNTMLAEAWGKQASDLHWHQEKERMLVTMRIDGRLHFMAEFDVRQRKQLISLLKLNAGMDISQHQQPQDGHFSFSQGAQMLDLRVASLPTVFGEDFVIRLLNQDQKYDLAELGFSATALKLTHKILKNPHGLILVTGPTGSGKTTTLYAFLKQLAQDRSKNIVTLEDPVEKTLLGLRQSQINPQIGYDFAAGLKAILRQDPDVIMIGEIRDRETARIALEAAYTGHLVLSTLHTADCQSTLLRLANFDLDPFLVLHSLKGILSQKLVLKRCPDCLPTEPCANCGFTGFRGRTVLTEMLEVGQVAYDPAFLHDMTKLITQNNFYAFAQDTAEKIRQNLLAPTS